MTVRGKRILVTGADGFIGSHLVEYLVKQGYAVTAFVLYNSFGSLGWLENVAPSVMSSVEIFQGDVRDADSVNASVRGIDAVLHLAALIAVPYSYTAPGSYVETNVQGTLNVLQAVRSADIAKLVCVSSSEVYGTPKSVPIDENHPLQAQSPYAASKLGAEHLAMSFYCSFGTPISVARPFNVYGPRQSGRAIIPAAIIQLARGMETIKLGNLSSSRDFNYVDDTVRGLVAMMECEKAVGQVINLGGSYEISINDVVQLIGEIMIVDVQIEIDSARLRPKDSEVDRLFADNSKARDILGWQPSYSGLSGLKKGLIETVDWFRSPAHLQMYKAEIYNV